MDFIGSNFGAAPFTDIASMQLSGVDEQGAKNIHNALKDTMHKVVFTEANRMCFLHVSKPQEKDAKSIIAGLGLKTAA
jgi:hypothetical protein